MSTNIQYLQKQILLLKNQILFERCLRLQQESEARKLRKELSEVWQLDSEIQAMVLIILNVKI